MSKIIKLTEKDISNLVKKVLKEERTTNYMFFGNLEQIKRQCEMLLKLDQEANPHQNQSLRFIQVLMQTDMQFKCVKEECLV